MAKQALQFAAHAYQARATQLLAQQCINAFVEISPKEAKTQVPIFGIPGLKRFSRIGRGPINGLWVMGDLLYALSGNVLFSITETGSAIRIGETTLGGICSMADNGRQLVMVDGGGGWIYQPGGLNQISTATVSPTSTHPDQIPANITGRITSGDALIIALDNGSNFTTTAGADANATSPFITLAAPVPSQVSAGAIILAPAVDLAQILAPAFHAADTVVYMDGYFIFNASGTRQFFLSAINDGTQYSGLDFATATANTGFVLAVVNFHEQLLIFTSKQSTEVWYNSGAAAFPFQRYDGVYIARGLSNSLATVNEDNTVFWMGDDGIFYRMDGFVPVRISDFAMEHQWAQYPLRYLDMTGFVLDQEGHKFVVCQFASGRATWVYDISTKLWHQRQSQGNPWV